MKKLTPHQIADIQRAYALLNYDADDLHSPIDPRSYRAPDGDRLIHIAAFRGDVVTVELLLDAGEDINAIGDMGETPAHNAATNLNKEVFDLLMSRGADPRIESEFGLTPAETWTFCEDEEAKARGA